MAAWWPVAATLQQNGAAKHWTTPHTGEVSGKSTRTRGDSSRGLECYNDRGSVCALMGRGWSNTFDTQPARQHYCHHERGNTSVSWAEADGNSAMHKDSARARSRVSTTAVSAVQCPWVMIDDNNTSPRI